MPIAGGSYLPFSLAPPILLGGILSWIVLRGSKTDEERESRAQRGVLFSSGVIAGEALVGVGLAGLAAIPYAARFRDRIAEWSSDAQKVAVGGGVELYDALTWAAIGLGILVFRLRTRASRL